MYNKELARVDANASMQLIMISGQEEKYFFPAYLYLLSDLHGVLEMGDAEAWVLVADSVVLEVV